VVYAYFSKVGSVFLKRGLERICQRDWSNCGRFQGELGSFGECHDGKLHIEFVEFLYLGKKFWELLMKI